VRRNDNDGSLVAVLNTAHEAETATTAYLFGFAVKGKSMAAEAGPRRPVAARSTTDDNSAAVRSPLARRATTSSCRTTMIFLET
jgi:hypothetical protein